MIFTSTKRNRPQKSKQLVTFRPLQELTLHRRLGKIPNRWFRNSVTSMELVDWARHVSIIFAVYYSSNPCYYSKKTVYWLSDNCYSESEDFFNFAERLNSGTIQTVPVYLERVFSKITKFNPIASLVPACILRTTIHSWNRKTSVSLTDKMCMHSITSPVPMSLSAEPFWPANPRLTCMNPAAQFRAALVLFRNMTGDSSSSLVTFPSSTVDSGRPLSGFGNSMLFSTWS